MTGTRTLQQFVPLGTRTLLLATLLAPLAAHSLCAQGGAWSPPNARLDYPRTLLSPNELDATRARLAGSPWRELYAGVVASTGAGVPADSASSSGRRARAGLAKNIAFVLLVDRAGDGITPLDTAQQSTLLAKALRVFNGMVTDVPAISITTPSAYDDWQWRSKELIDLLCAYDMLRGAGAGESLLAEGRRRLQQFAGNLHREANRSILGFTFFGLVVNNHALMTAGALGTAAVVLNDAVSTDPDEQPQRWIATALWHIDDVFWRNSSRQSEHDAVVGYAEGPYYLRYAALNLFPFYRALANFLPDTTLSINVDSTARDVRHPWYDPALDSLYRWSVTASLPNGAMAPLEDSYVNTAFPEWALVNRAWPTIAGGTAQIAAQLNSTVDMRANAVAAGEPSNSLPSNAQVEMLQDAGLLVLRDVSATGLRDTVTSQLTLTARSGRGRTAGAGHNQADELSFLLWGGGETMALDPGYVKYDRRGEVGEATDHNMILVDGAGPAIGSPGAPGGADASVDAAFSIGEAVSAPLAPTPHIAYGRARTNYRGAEITRSVLLLPDGSWGLIDRAVGGGVHSYTWQLHGNGLGGGDSLSGTFTGDMAEGTAAWQHGDAVLHAAVQSCDGATIDTTNGTHEVSYDKTGTHTVLHATRRDTATTFAALLRVGSTAATAPLFRTRTLEGAAIISTEREMPGGIGEQTLLIAQRDTTTLHTYTDSLPAGIDTVEVRGRGGWLGTTNNAYPFVQTGWLLEEGTLLEFASTLAPQNRASVYASQPVTLAVVLDQYRSDGSRWEGWIDRAATVTMQVPLGIGSVEGENVAQVETGNNGGRTVTFNGPGHFRIVAEEELGVERAQALETGIAATVTDGVAMLTISPANEHGAHSLAVADPLGRTVRTLELADGTRAIRVEGLRSGIYFCRVLSATHSVAHGSFVIP